MGLHVVLGMQSLHCHEWDVHDVIVHDAPEGLCWAQLMQCSVSIVSFLCPIKHLCPWETIIQWLHGAKVSWWKATCYFCSYVVLIWYKILVFCMALFTCCMTAVTRMSSILFGTSIPLDIHGSQPWCSPMISWVSIDWSSF